MSAVIPSHNHARFLPFALDTVLAQRRPADEVLVVDDGSTDDTAAVLEKYARRVLSFFRPPEGIGATYNFGVRAARGDVVAFLESDDGWDERYLEETVGFLERHPEVAWVSTARRLMDSRGEPVGRPFRKPSRGPLFTTESILRSDLGFSPTPVVLREALLEAGPFRLDTYAADSEMMLRFSVGRRMAYLDLPLYLYRVHGGNVSRSALANARELLRILERFAREQGDDSGVSRRHVRRCLAKYQGRVAVMAAEEDPDSAREEVLRLLGEAIRNHPTKLKHARRWLAARLLGPERYGRWRRRLLGRAPALAPQ